MTDVETGAPFASPSRIPRAISTRSIAEERTWRRLSERGDTPELQVLERRLASLGPFSAEQRASLNALCGCTERHPPGKTLISEGHQDAQAKAVLVGWGCRARFLRDGRRQIVSFLLPGDLVAPTEEACCTITTITAMATVDVSSWFADGGNEPRGASSLRSVLSAALDEERFWHLQAIVRLGQMTAYERIINHLLELHVRLSSAGLLSGASYRLPVTQEHLADANGLSVVHTNRTLRALREDNLVILEKGQLRFPDLERARAVGLFEAPPYLARGGA